VTADFKRSSRLIKKGSFGRPGVREKPLDQGPHMSEADHAGGVHWEKSLGEIGGNAERRPYYSNCFSGREHGR